MKPAPKAGPPVKTPAHGGNQLRAYRRRASAWGRDYATEGARALVRRAFTDLGASKIVATTMAVNTASRRVLEMAGLNCTRTVYLDRPDPLPGNEHGDVEYQLNRSDWAPR